VGNTPVGRLGDGESHGKRKNPGGKRIKRGRKDAPPAKLGEGTHCGGGGAARTHGREGAIIRKAIKGNQRGIYAATTPSPVPSGKEEQPFPFEKGRTLSP